MTLTDALRERYEKNIKVLEIGEGGQQRLLSSRVLVIGAGGLGSAAILYLAAAGVGGLSIVDDDVVALSNLQRQVIHGAGDIGRPKAHSAADSVRRLNPDVRVAALRERAGEENVRTLVADHDFVLDCTDNLATKLLVNDACVEGGKAFCYGGVLALHGQALTYTPGHACLRCALEVPVPLSAAPTSHELGVLGAAAGMLGSLQAAEAVKFLTGAGVLLTDTLLSFDLLTCRFRTVQVRRPARCPACGRPRGH